MRYVKWVLLVLVVLSLVAPVAMAQDDSGAGLTIGFSQIGSESAWRTSFTNAVKAEAEARGINLLFSDAQQQQENQIAAMRAWIAQGDVDAIILTPTVASGWDEVLQEAADAGIPVVIVDRNVDCRSFAVCHPRFFGLRARRPFGGSLVSSGDLWTVQYRGTVRHGRFGSG